MTTPHDRHCHRDKTDNTAPSSLTWTQAEEDHPDWDSQLWHGTRNGHKLAAIYQPSPQHPWRTNLCCDWAHRNNWSNTTHPTITDAQHAAETQLDAWLTQVTPTNWEHTNQRHRN